MPLVSLLFPPSAEHVRIARLVAVATARRGWLTEERLDELRLAVGEICARAVRRCLAAGPADAPGPIRMEIEDDGGVLIVRVTDPAPDPTPPAAAEEPAPPGSPPYDPAAEQRALEQEEAIALALVQGLADQVVVGPGSGGEGGRVVMTWNRSR
jgi:anti-sigma regulatory factor (Ser/Thr protein kinase)